jgi:hypothetical protein
MFIGIPTVVNSQITRQVLHCDGQSSAIASVKVF